MTTLPTFDFLMLQLKLKGIWQHRSLGQHFLTDSYLLERIAAATLCGPQSLAVEIGPGPGTLTTQLAARAGGLVAIEFDPRMKALHDDAFGTVDQAQFIYADAMKMDLQRLAREAMARWRLSEAVLTGNLPFQITSPLLFGQCGPDAPWRAMVVMIQREVADRICAAPHSKAYGILSVKLAYWWRVRERFEVSAERFFPRPQVDAAVLVFERKDAAGQPTREQWPGLSAFVDAAFGQRRKMLFNSLAGRWQAYPGKDTVIGALEALGISEKARAEDLTPGELLVLYRLIVDGAKKKVEPGIQPA